MHESPNEKGVSDASGTPFLLNDPENFDHFAFTIPNESGSVLNFHESDAI
jgi:hypothetical protein